jgi:hypothetical protein
VGQPDVNAIRFSTQLFVIISITTTTSTTTTMPSQYQATEARIQTACSAARGVKNPNIAVLAREYDVSAHRLRARYKGRASRTTRHMAYKRLDDEQEAVLIG